jgi:hypothetical protein
MTLPRRATPSFTSVGPTPGRVPIGSGSIRAREGDISRSPDLSAIAFALMPDSLGDIIRCRRCR